MPKYLGQKSCKQHLIDCPSSTIEGTKTDDVILFSDLVSASQKAKSIVYKVYAVKETDDTLFTTCSSWWIGCRQPVRQRSVILRLYKHHKLPAIRQNVCFASWLKMCGDLFQTPCTTSNFHHGNAGESHWRCLFSLPRSFFSHDWLVEFCAGLINPLVSGHWWSLALLKGCGPSCSSGAVGCSWLWTFWRGNPGELGNVVIVVLMYLYGKSRSTPGRVAS